jgi:hypothetical protein
MSSSITDFKNQIAKSHPNVRISRKLDNNIDTNIYKENPYKRTVTVNNTGKTVKSNYIFCFQIDHFNLYLNNKSAYTFCDLRIYDGTTLLEHYVQHPASPNTSVFVVIPSLPASSKALTITYGNPSLENLSNIDVLGSNFFATSSYSSNLKDWFRSTEVNRTYYGVGDFGTYGLTNFGTLTQWKNLKSNNHGILRLDDLSNSALFPSLSLSQINNLPSVWFDGSDKLDNALRNWQSNSTSAIVVFKANSVSTGSFFGGAPADMQFVLGGGKMNFVKSQVVNLGTSTTTITAGAWNIGSYSYNGTNLAFYLNGVADGTATNAQTGFGAWGFLGRNGNGEFLDGDIAELMILNSSLTSTQQLEIHNYLNQKYKIYSTSDIPSFSVGSESANTDYKYTFKSYAPLTTFNFTSKLSKDFFGFTDSSIEINLQHLLFKYFSDENFQTWSNSTLDKTSKINNIYSRKVVATTTANTDTVTIERTESGNNLNDLSVFGLENMVETTTYTSEDGTASSDSDFIQFDIFITNIATFDFTNSKLRFENTAGTLSYESVFDISINDFQNGLNIFKVRKASFTKSGTGNWSNITKMKVITKTTSGSQNVYYGLFKLEADINTIYKIGDLVQLASCVSSDEDVSYYCQNLIEGVIIDNYISKNDSKLVVKDFLNVFLEKKFSDFDSFPSSFWNCDAVNEQGFLSISDPDKKYFTYFLKKILNFAFPNDFLDIDLDFSFIGIEGSTGKWWIKPSDKVGDVVEKLLTACGGVIRYDYYSNKIVARNSQKIWDSYSYSPSVLESSLPLATNQILEYKDDTSATDFLYNYVKLNYDFIAPTSIPIGTFNFFDKTTNYTIPALSSATFFLKSDEQLYENQEVLDMAYWGGWQVSVDPQSYTYSNTNTSITNIEIIDNNIAITLKNNNSDDRYLYALYIYAFSLPVTQENFDFEEFKNTNSIKKNSKKELEIDKKYQVGGQTLASLVNQWGEKKKKYQLDVLFNPELRIGKRITFKNIDDMIITALIIEISLYSQGGVDKITLTVVEL